MENRQGDVNMENKTDEIQKTKKSCLGQLMKWLIILGIFGGLGYLIWQNGGIPEEGFNLGEIVGTETPEGLVDEELMERLENMEYPEDFEVVQKTMQINDAAGQNLAVGYSILYHIDSKASEFDKQCNLEMVSAITGMTEWEKLIGVGYSSNASRFAEIGATFLLEFETETDTEQLAETIKAQMNPKEWNFASEEYNEYYHQLEDENIAIEAKGKYVFIALVGDELLKLNRSSSPEALAGAFKRVIE